VGSLNTVNDAVKAEKAQGKIKRMKPNKEKALKAF